MQPKASTPVVEARCVMGLRNIQKGAARQTHDCRCGRAKHREVINDVLSPDKNEAVGENIVKCVCGVHHEGRLSVITDTPQAPICERTREQIGDGLVPRVTKEILEGIKDSPQKFISELKNVLLAILLWKVEQERAFNKRSNLRGSLLSNWRVDINEALRMCEERSLAMDASDASCVSSDRVDSPWPS